MANKGGTAGYSRPCNCFGVTGRFFIVPADGMKK